MTSDGLTEGRTRLFPPATNLSKPMGAPGAKAKGVPFYNPGMALNRDLSLILVAAEAARRGREIDVADVLAGTGARALRIAHELESPLIVHANDGDATAIAALRRGASANHVPDQRLRISQGDAHTFLAARRYDVVDVDPYGSPMPFVDAALRATRHDGLLCITATDTGALAGRYTAACQRRYDAHHGLHRQAWRSEVGLRILAGAVVRAAGRHERSAHPVLCVSHGHWMRVVARVEDGRDAQGARDRLGDAVATETGSGRFLAPDETRPKHWAGPLWTGALHDAAFVTALQGLAVPLASKQTRPLVDLFVAEAQAAPFWVNPDNLRSSLGDPPRRDRLIANLQQAGLTASRTHLDPQGVRTDATEDQLRAAWTATG